MSEAAGDALLSVISYCPSHTLLGSLEHPEQSLISLRVQHFTPVFPCRERKPAWFWRPAQDYLALKFWNSCSENKEVLWCCRTHVLAIGTALSPSAIPWICNENEDGLVWSPAGAHLSSVKYRNIFLLEIGRWLSFKLQRGEQLSSFLHSLSCLSIWFRLSSGHAAVTHFSCLSETRPQSKCLAWDPRMTFVRLHYEPDLSLYTWELSLALKKALQKPRDGHYDTSGCNKPLYIEDNFASGKCSATGEGLVDTPARLCSRLSAMNSITP